MTEAELHNGAKKCFKCDGLGWIMGFQTVEDKMVPIQEQCGECWGTGWINDIKREDDTKDD